MDFPFHQVYKLDDYRDNLEPAVFFGAYRYEDVCLMHDHNNHRPPTVFWTGQDALDNVHIGKWYRNVTAHPNIKKRFDKYGYECQLVQPAAWLNKKEPQVLGKKIYAYCPDSAPDYHGKNIIDDLRCGGYEVVIGDGQFTQQQWRNSLADFHYNQCFIGLCLSEFCGGGASILEMGLRGVKVVTNVFNLPNCIPWNSIDDVVQAIEDQTQYIGHSNPGLAQYVWDVLDHKHEWLEI